MCRVLINVSPTRGRIFFDELSGAGQSGGIGDVLEFIADYVEVAHIDGQAGEPQKGHQTQGRQHRDGPLCSLDKFS